MAGYVLSVLGIVVAGVIIDVIIPSGQINKYIKSIYSIFVVAVLLSPLIKIVNGSKKIEFTYTNFEMDQSLIEYINEQKVENLQKTISQNLYENGFKNVDILINYSINDNIITYNSCIVNLKNLAIDDNVQHINKYEFIKDTIKSTVDLTEEEIKIYEWFSD